MAKQDYESFVEKFKPRGDSMAKQDYESFVEKFKPKKTTDDCYTPVNIYDVVAEYVADTYNKRKSDFVRPFWPGADYQNFDYKDGCVVVDNPPFSIMKEIVTWYTKRNIDFFLFAPALTVMNYIENACAICLQVCVVYENGAKVSTSFLTNLDKKHTAISEPCLYRLIEEANAVNIQTRTLPKYKYPNAVVTAALMGKLSKYGQSFKVKKIECERIRALDSQRDVKKTIYGAGLLISKKAMEEKAMAEKAMAEKAMAEKSEVIEWSLSKREFEMIERLSDG